MSKRTANTLAALRQLACSGRSASSIVPEIFSLLDRLVGSENDQGIFLNEQCGIQDAYYSSPISLPLMLELQEYFEKNPYGDGSVVTAAMAMERGLSVVRSSRFASRQTMLDGEFYHRFGRTSGLGWVCQIHLRDGMRPLASLSLARPFSLPDFSAADEALCVQAVPWLTHALSAPPAKQDGSPEPWLSSGESATVLLSGEGKLLSASSHALVLLCQAADTSLSEGARSPGQGRLQAMTSRLARDTVSALRGRPSTLPHAIRSNRYGRFKLRAYAMEALDRDTQIQVLLLIERQVPLSVRLFTSEAFLSLSARERDVCLRILAGRSQPEIASDLGLRPSSVIQHTRSIYNRLAITGQKELLPALLPSEPAV